MTRARPAATALAAAAAMRARPAVALASTQLAAAALAVAAFGCAPDPCEGAGTCLAVTVSAGSLEGDRLDELEVDILYGNFHDTVTTQASGAARLPVTTALRLDVTVPGTATGAPIAAIVVAAKLAGQVLGTGATSSELVSGGHAAVEIELAPPGPCIDRSFYCGGGDKLDGVPGVLYLCNVGGVPLARGRCAFKCVINEGDDDTCGGGDATCKDGGFYCGGDKLDGDPRSLYQCMGGVGINRRECANGCVVNRDGQDDACALTPPAADARPAGATPDGLRLHPI